MMASKALTPGSTARIFRDGGVLLSQVIVPEEGRFEVRHLDPGQYVARDECGGEVAFEVKALEEVTVIAGSGDPVGPTGQPGTGNTRSVPIREVGPQPIPNEFAPEHTAASPGRRHLTTERAESDQSRVPAAPGSALVEPVEEPSLQPGERGYAEQAPDPEAVARAVEQDREAAREREATAREQDAAATRDRAERDREAAQEKDERQAREHEEAQNRARELRERDATPLELADESPAPGTTTPVETVPEKPAMGTTVTRPSGDTKQT